MQAAFCSPDCIALHALLRTISMQLFCTKFQRMVAAQAAVAPSFLHQSMPSGGKNHFFCTVAAVNKAFARFLHDGVLMAALGFQSINLAHNGLPLRTVWANVAAKGLISHQVRDLMGDCLKQKMALVFAVERRVKAQFIFL